MAMISGSLLEVACIYLSRVRSLLRTLAIAEYGMFDSIEGTVKEGNRSIVLGSIHRGDRQRREPKYRAWFHMGTGARGNRQSRRWVWAD